MLKWLIAVHLSHSGGDSVLCSDRYIISLFRHFHTPFPPFSPSLINLAYYQTIKKRRTPPPPPPPQCMHIFQIYGRMFLTDIWKWRWCVADLNWKQTFRLSPWGGDKIVSLVAENCAPQRGWIVSLVMENCIYFACIREVLRMCHVFESLKKSGYYLAVLWASVAAYIINAYPPTHANVIKLGGGGGGGVHILNSRKQILGSYFVFGGKTCPPFCVLNSSTVQSWKGGLGLFVLLFSSLIWGRGWAERVRQESKLFVSSYKYTLCVCVCVLFQPV